MRGGGGSCWASTGGLEEGCSGRGQYDKNNNECYQKWVSATGHKSEGGGGEPSRFCTNAVNKNTPGLIHV